MRALITGINGFLGRYTATLLANQGYDIIGIGRDESSIIPTQIYICGSLGQKGFVEYAVNRLGKVDAIIHLAANLSMSFYDKDVLSDNAMGMQDILQIAEMTDAKHFVYMSSIMVYGKPQYKPLDEKHPLSPPTLYHCSKLFGEYLLQAYKKNHPDFAATIFRMTSPIGVGMRKNFLRIVLENAISGKGILLYGRGGRVQNYIDVRDAAQAIYVALDKSVNGTFNLGGEKSYSNLQAAKVCLKLCESRSKIVFDGIDPQENDIWALDLSEFIKRAQYKHNYSIEDSIRWMITSGDIV